MILVILLRSQTAFIIMLAFENITVTFHDYDLMIGDIFNDRCTFTPQTFHDQVDFLLSSRFLCSKVAFQDIGEAF